MDVEEAQSLDGDREEVNRPEVPVSLVMPEKKRSEYTFASAPKTVL
jgi:hypothetical protein